MDYAAFQHNVSGFLVNAKQTDFNCLNDFKPLKWQTCAVYTSLFVCRSSCCRSVSSVNSPIHLLAANSPRVLITKESPQPTISCSIELCVRAKERGERERELVKGTADCQMPAALDFSTIFNKIVKYQ